MTNTIKFWIPAGDLTQGQCESLAVPATSKPERDQFNWRLAERLQMLIDQSHEAAQSALEMSQEHAPEMWQIAQNEPSKNWAQALMNSDSMHSLISRIDWSQPGSLQSPLDLPQDLQSLLEQLP